MIDLNEMVIFAEVIKAGSFTKAGQKLGLPKSTISRKISLLEERLGVLLIQRTTRSLNLTDAGSVYYQQCSRIMTEAKEADSLATEKQMEPTGLIRIAAAPGFVFLSEFLADFLAEYNQIELEINFERRTVDMVSEGYDVAVRVGPLKDSSLVGRVIGIARVLFCASPEYIERNGAPEKYEDLKKHRLIQGIPWSVGSDSAMPLTGLPKRIKTNENEIARLLTIKGLGISLLSESDCAEDIRRGHLKQVLYDYPLPEKKIYLIYPSNRHLSFKITKFIEFMLDRWKSSPPW